MALRDEDYVWLMKCGCVSDRQREREGDHGLMNSWQKDSLSPLDATCWVSCHDLGTTVTV